MKSYVEVVRTVSITLDNDECHRLDQILVLAEAQLDMLPDVEQEDKDFITDLRHVLLDKRAGA